MPLRVYKGSVFNAWHGLPVFNGQWSMVNGQWSMVNVQCSMKKRSLYGLLHISSIAQIELSHITQELNLTFFR